MKTNWLNNAQRYSRQNTRKKKLGFGIVILLVMASSSCSWFPSAQEPDYQFISAWGELGSEPGQFHDPTGIAVNETEVFVSDARNARIQVFDYQGRFKRQFGRKGDAFGQLGRPMNLTLDGDELYVADYFNDRIHVFALDGTPLRMMGKSGNGPGEFNSPGGVAIAPNGDLYVADFYNQRVQHLKADGQFIEQWGTTGAVGFWAGEFNYPTDVTLARDGSFYVADGYNDRVQVFSDTGEFQYKWGGPFALNIFGPFNGWFATVTSVEHGPKGNLFVADFYNHRIQKFTSDGIFLTSFGEEGSAAGQFNYAMAMAIASDNTLFVVDYGNHRIQKWQPSAKRHE
tara:strand:- start:5657 stop:6682 length:1026 start_codon:yes stop_codon:yes gene_type:complete